MRELGHGCYVSESDGIVTIRHVRGVVCELGVEETDRAGAFAFAVAGADELKDCWATCKYVGQKRGRWETH